MSAKTIKTGCNTSFRHEIFENFKCKLYFVINLYSILVISETREVEEKLRSDISHKKEVLRTSLFESFSIF